MYLNNLKNCDLAEDKTIISRIDQPIYVSAIIRYQVTLHLGAIFSSKLCENIFVNLKEKKCIWIFLIKKANNTFKTFKIPNAELSHDRTLTVVLKTGLLIH